MLKTISISALLFWLITISAFGQRNQKLNELSKEGEKEQNQGSGSSSNSDDNGDNLSILDLFVDFFVYTYAASVGYGSAKVDNEVYYVLKRESDINLGTAGKNYLITNWRTELQLGLYSMDYRRYSTFEKYNGESYNFRTDDIQILEINPINTQRVRLQAGVGVTSVHNYDLNLTEFTLGARYYAMPSLYFEAEYRQAAKVTDVVFRREINLNTKYRPFDKLRFLQVNLTLFYAKYFESEDFYGIHGGVGLNMDGWKRSKDEVTQ